MKKRLFFILSMAIMLVCILAISASAATTNEFGSVETIDGIDLTNMNTETEPRVVLTDGNGNYHTYPSQYVVTDNTTFSFNFKPLNDKLGTSYNADSVVRIEVPDNILVAPKTGVLCSRKSLVEIKFSPNSQLTTLEYGCFYNNKKLEKLNIPKNVTTMGTLLINNSNLKELIFDEGFSAIPPKDSFIGASGLEKIVFSNQMTTMYHSAFNSTLGEELKVVVLGASLKDFGDVAPENGGGGSGNFPWAKFPFMMYASDTLFSDIDTIERGRLTGWNGTSLPNGVLFYTGSKAQAQALIDKAEANTPIFYDATLTEWDSSVADEAYMPEKGWVIVYGYNSCKAFYNNEHKIDTSALTLDFNSYTDSFSESCACQNGCGLDAVVNKYEPIFGGFMYSVKENGTALCTSYSINHHSLAVYKSYNASTNISYGLVASVAPTDNEVLLTLDGGKVVTGKENAILVDIDTKYASFDFILRGFKADGSYDNIAFAINAYVTDGKSIYYIGNSTSNNYFKITMAEIKNS